jgi:hypothetical protein
VTETFVITDRTLKLVIAACVTFFVNSPQSGLVATLVVVCALLIVTIRHRPCRDLVFVNFIRVVIYLLAIWSLISSLIARNAYSKPTTEYFPVRVCFVRRCIFSEGETHSSAFFCVYRRFSCSVDGSLFWACRGFSSSTASASQQPSRAVA